MDLLIVMKWLTNYAVAGVTPPSIITTMIEIFVEFAQEKPD